MASAMVSRWPVLLALPVEPDDLDASGRLTDAAIERLFSEARSAYFDKCTTVDPTRLDARGVTAGRGPAPAGTGVTISVNVTEVFPDRFTMAAMIRPADDDGIAGTARCSLSPGGDVPKAMRDEFIALAHGARHFH